MNSTTSCTEPLRDHSSDGRERSRNATQHEGRARDSDDGDSNLAVQGFCLIDGVYSTKLQTLKLSRTTTTLHALDSNPTGPDTAEWQLSYVGLRPVALAIKLDLLRYWSGGASALTSKRFG